MSRAFLYILCLCSLSQLRCGQAEVRNLPVKRLVDIRFQDGRYQIYRFGKPYFIKGVCVEDSRNLRLLKNLGGNSVRLYSTIRAAEVLDSANALGLSVMLGLELLPEGPKMDYGDERAVNEQFNRAKQEVLKYRKYPALLMWSVGNELGVQMTLASFLKERRIWIQINRIAAMIHELDPDHPTTTAVEGPSKLLYVKSYGDQIELASINSFKPLEQIREKMSAYGWNKPYVISEYGSTGYWFKNFTEWYTYYEETSFEKMQFIARQYHSIRSDSTNCLGSYAFFWGQKNECTPTYFSLFTEDGKQTEMIDILTYCWTGKYPAEKSVSLLSLFINNQQSSGNIYLEPGKSYQVQFTCLGSPVNSILKWRVDRDDDDLYFDPMLNQEKRKNISRDSVVLTDQPKSANLPDPNIRFSYVFTITAPAEPGPYRLFLFLEKNQKVSTANACFYVHE